MFPNTGYFWPVKTRKQSALVHSNHAAKTHSFLFYLQQCLSFLLNLGQIPISSRHCRIIPVEGFTANITLEYTTNLPSSNKTNPQKFNKMSYYSRAEGIILKYLHFLNEKNVVQDYKIKKSLARSLYMEEFKPKHHISRFPFSSMYRVMLEFGLINYKSRRSDVIQFKDDSFNYAIRYYINDLNDESSSSKPNTTETTVVPKRSAKMKNKASSQMKCHLCNLVFSTQALLDKHEASEQHLERAKFTSEHEQEEQNGSALVIEVKNGYGGKSEPVIVRQNNKENVIVKIINKSQNTYTVENIKAITNSKKITLHKPQLPYSLGPNTYDILNLSVLFEESMFQTYPLLVKLKNTSTKQPMEVIKKIMFHVHSNLVDDLHPTQPYKASVKPDVRDSDYEIIPGLPPPRTSTNVPVKFKLAQYPLPQYVSVLLEHNFTESSNMSNSEKNMLGHILRDFASFSKNGTLDVKNYFNLSQLRLYMEEYQMKIDIRLYDVDNQTLNSVPKLPKNMMELFVPGLAEHRPSLLKGDSVYVQDVKGSKVKYEGIVNKVNKDSVLLGFGYRFVDTVHIDNKKYSVSFGFNRVPLRAEHQAIDLAKKHGIIPLLCPSGVHTSPLNNYSIHWSNPDIITNEKQQSAVKHILSETSRPLPYLIFGPPGTGKTCTVVEAIIQIRIHKPQQRILVSAPSNFAADVIMKRLIKGGLSKMHLFRYVAPSYSYDLIDSAIKPYTNFQTEFYHPPNSELLKYYVIVTTLVTASRLVNGGTPAGHFSYVFIDESGHATESETLIPITGILTSAEKPGVINGQIVLAGDPQQLGPIIHSQRANSFGFGMSMLERFMTKCSVYKKSDDGYNDHVLTKLVKSYRSHPAILALPNKLFYDEDLIAPEERKLTDIAIGWDELPNKNFPVVFHCVVGKDEREANSPSFFNVQEIDIVLNYLQKLIGSRLQGMRIEQDHIGIITPYRKQVHKLQAVCRKKGWNNLMVGSVEQFQGQERLIIIVSTVRSRPEFTTHDEKFHLGFLKNPKRFNVAVTRAKALLIVIGNPNILQHDECWRQFIQYCLDNSSTRGTPFNLQPPIKIEVVEKENEDSANFSRGNIDYPLNVSVKHHVYTNTKMELELFRVDYNIVGITTKSCMKLLPCAKSGEQQKVVIGDNDGILQVFCVKKEDIQLQFKTLPGHKITSVQISGEPGTTTDKIFISSQNEVRGYTKKGKLFLSFDSNMTEPITSMYVLGNDLFLCGKHTYNHYKDCKDIGSYLCGDCIVDIVALHTDKSRRLISLIACEGRMIRALEHARVTLTMEVESSPTVLHIYQNDEGKFILFGTVDGRIGLLDVENKQSFSKWIVDDKNHSSSITCITSYSLVESEHKNLILGRQDGNIEVYAVNLSDENEQSKLLYITNCNESVTAICCGIVGDPNYEEILVATYTGRIFGLTTQTIEHNLSADTKNYYYSADTAQKITKLRSEIEELQVKVDKEREKYQASTQSYMDEMSAIPLLSIKDSMVQSKEDSSYIITLEVPTAIDNVLLQSNVPVDLLDVEKNSAVNNNFLLATYRCQVNTNRLELKIRTIEGQYGTLQAYVTPIIQPKCCQVKQFEIKPLSMHLRVHTFDRKRPVNALTIKGQFSLAEIHSWVYQCIPEVPEKPQFTEATVLYFQSTFLGSLLECNFQKGEGKFMSDNISTISVIREFLTKEATKKKIKVDISVNVNDDTINHILQLIDPKLQAHAKLSHQILLLNALHELSVNEEETINALSAEYKNLLEDEKRLRLEYSSSPSYLDRLYGVVTDLYIDYYKFKGVSVKSKIPKLLTILEKYDYKSLLEFFRPELED
ncbi:hypothetical protein RN001_003541 [Aquatica leii]|uniref:RNA helicase n=1 Tax=Aquatica leii TaxID=1421715 RepID=A0AAN7QBS2_9COLE|nr:hypothetical protein RN001_003541 [Aquatica leii]